MRADTAIELALRCYPVWWRERYGDEVLVLSDDLRAEGRSTATVMLNLLVGAVQARWRAKGMPKSYGPWAARTRVSIAAATLPWLVVAPLVLMATGSETFHSSAGSPMWSGFSFMPRHLQIDKHAILMPAPPLASAAPIVMYAALAITVLFLMTFIVLIGGWSGFTRAIKTSGAPNRRRLRLFAWTPALALLADVALVIAQDASRPNTWTGSGTHYIASGGNPTALHVLDVVLPTVAIAGWLLSLVCVATAARRADIAAADLRFGRSVAVIVAVLFTLLLAAYATWGIALIVQARQSVNGNFTTVAYSHEGLWLPMMALLIIAVGLSAAGARAARSAWRVIASTCV